MKHILWIFLAMYSTAMVVACAGGSSNGVDGVAAAQVGCPSGTTFINGTCYNQSMQAVQTGGVGFKTDNFKNKTLSVPDATAYRTFLKEALGLCERPYTNYSSVSCDTYMNSYLHVVLEAVNTETNTARLVIEVQPISYAATAGFNLYGQLPSPGQSAVCGITWLLSGTCQTNASVNSLQTGRALSLDLVVSKINNDEGFQGSAYAGSYGTTTSSTNVILFQVNHGKLTDGYFDYQIAYKGSSQGTFMNGRMERCTDTSCGVYYY